MRFLNIKQEENEDEKDGTAECPTASARPIATPARAASPKAKGAQEPCQMKSEEMPGPDVDQAGDEPSAKRQKTEGSTLTRQARPRQNYRPQVTFCEPFFLEKTFPSSGKAVECCPLAIESDDEREDQKEGLGTPRVRRRALEDQQERYDGPPPRLQLRSCVSL